MGNKINILNKTDFLDLEILNVLEKIMENHSIIMSVFKVCSLYHGTVIVTIRPG